MTQPPLSPKDQMPQSQYCIQFLFFWYQKKAQLKTLQHLPLELATGSGGDSLAQDSNP